MLSFDIYPYLIIIIIAYITSTPKIHKRPITENTIYSIQKELDDWDNEGSDYNGDGDPDEGRFIHHSVSYADGTLIIYITTHSSANYIAKRSFCNIVRDLHKKYAPEYYLIASITPNGMIADALDCNSNPLKIPMHK